MGGGAGRVTEWSDRRVLVLTTVHPADDPRVRYRTVGVLAGVLPVRYASPPPAPRRRDGFEWVGLTGRRPLRVLRALREALRRDVAVVSVHDPELVVVALAARAAGRRAVVDVHEDVPAQIRDKPWVPAPLRRPLAAAATALLRLAEQSCTVTLAEANYAQLLRRPHPVFANHPIADDLPDPRPVGEPRVVYVGDITAARGAELLVRAVGRLDPRPQLEMIGRCREPLRGALVRLAAEVQVDLQLPGYLDHSLAMDRVAGAGVGVSPLLGEPNHRQSLPSKVIEYLSLGVPVVASDLPGTRRVVAGLPGVRLVAPGDLDAWSRSLAEVLGDRALRQAAQRGVAAVRRDHTWASAELQALYRREWQAATDG